MGLIKIKDGVPFVVEAVGPVREYPLDAWIDQSIGGRVLIKRVKNLSDADALRVLAAARPYYGLPYDHLFLFDKASIYCSELIYYAFKEGIGFDIGKVETLAELNTDNAVVQKLIKSRWKSHPSCKNKANSFAECNKILLTQELVTPASIAADDRLVTIKTNYAVLD